MVGHELAVEQPVAADAQPSDQPGERHLRGVGAQREHGFAEEGGAEIDAVEAAGQLLVLPAFDRMGVAVPVEEPIALLDLLIDPRLLAVGAAAHDLGERLVARHGEGAGA